MSNYPTSTSLALTRFSPFFSRGAIYASVPTATTDPASLLSAVNALRDSVEVVTRQRTVDNSMVTVTEVSGIWDLLDQRLKEVEKRLTALEP